MESAFVLPSHVAATYVEIMDVPLMHMHDPKVCGIGSVLLLREDGFTIQLAMVVTICLPFFTGEASSSNQRSQSQLPDRRNLYNPFSIVTADCFESVNTLERNVINRIVQLANDLVRLTRTLKSLLKPRRRKKIRRKLRKKKRRKLRKRKLKLNRKLRRRRKNRM